MGCKWCLKSGLEMNCDHQCVFCFGNGFRTVCNCIEDDNDQYGEYYECDDQYGEYYES